MKAVRLPSWPRPGFVLALVLLAWLSFQPDARAHRLDEYLQATVVVIEPGEIRLQMDLTPGVAVADSVLAQIDRNRDGIISKEEAAAYAAALNRDLAVTLDAQPLPLKLVASHFPAPAELRAGVGIIQIELAAAPGAFTPGAHRLTIQNRHLPAMSVYLLNAGMPAFFAPPQAHAGAIEITAQKRNGNQSIGTIGFTFHPAAKITAPTPHTAPGTGLIVAIVSVILLAAWSMGKSGLRLRGAPPSARVSSCER